MSQLSLATVTQSRDQLGEAFSERSRGLLFQKNNGGCMPPGWPSRDLEGAAPPVTAFVCAAWRMVP